MSEIIGSQGDHVYQRRREESFRFDKSINLGSVLIIVSMLFSLAIAWGKIQSQSTEVQVRLIAVEALTARHEVIIQQQREIIARLTTLSEIYLKQGK